MRRALALLAAAGGLAVLFATAAHPTHVVRRRRPVVVGITYCIETSTSTVAPYKPTSTTSICQPGGTYNLAGVSGG